MSTIEKEEEKHLGTSNILFNEKLLKFPILKIIQDDYDIKINSKSSLIINKDDEIKDLKDILSKKPNIKCFECEKEINSFDFFINKGNKDKFICKECYAVIKEKNSNAEYISLDSYISTCNKHAKKYELFCINCNMNMCLQCKEEHLDLGSKHEFIIYENILMENEIKEKRQYCDKIKNLCEVFKNISEIKFKEGKFKEGTKFQKVFERFSRENKFAEIIISTFSYFLEQKSLCYEIISNFNEIGFNKELKEIDIKRFFDKENNLLESPFHIIMQSNDIIETKKVKIIPLSNRERIESKISLDSEIRGLIELKGGYYLAGSLDGKLCIFDSAKLELKQNLKINGINKIFHMEKIKDENLDLIAIASDLNEVIIISVFQKPKENDIKDKEDFIFDYKIECRKEEHTGSINRIIQLSNGLIVSSAKDKLVIFWNLIKKDDIFDLQSISKIKMDSEIYVLIEYPFNNELICNDKTIDLNSYNFKRELNIFLQDKNFNCSICLFKEKYLAYVVECDYICVLNLETGKEYLIYGSFDYVEAVYSMDNETFCLCTQNLESFFRPRFSQHFKLEEDNFVEIGKMTYTGTCNCYLIDSKNNFVMGDMGGILSKYLV